MDVNDPALLRTARAFAKQQYEKQMVQAAGPTSAGLDAIGPPTWSPAAWEEFKAKFGRYPSLQEGDVPNLAGAPAWVFEKMGMRKPPVDVTTGSGSVGGAAVDPLGAGNLEVLKGRRDG